jgi:hypothetical protein
LRPFWQLVPIRLQAAGRLLRNAQAALPQVELVLRKDAPWWRKLSNSVMDFRDKDDVLDAGSYSLLVPAPLMAITGKQGRRGSSAPASISWQLAPWQAGEGREGDCRSLLCLRATHLLSPTCCHPPAATHVLSPTAARSG